MDALRQKVVQHSAAEVDRMQAMRAEMQAQMSQQQLLFQQEATIREQGLKMDFALKQKNAEQMFEQLGTDASLRIFKLQQAAGDALEDAERRKERELAEM